ncbi:lipocalin family protein [Advenella sp. WQ 585]|jgi:apolipoprotein D and lipocalin family protein|uniref:Outer membrane lipoprotein Blc n=2 Tax=Advenella TaxID=290425 RepID=A0ABS6NLH9_9BURK|nr:MULTISPECIES: lipocalin family protein [Advenella]MBK1782616.1 lipocalin family protein [Advenella mandrilli]MBV4396485.1 lipocalin family protein [Advenella alkanexedens]MDD3757675.1 lipocalin family protein [Advenella sp.]NLN66897.1 lipocalin [Alcaligenaceae bacterium]
MRYVLMFLFVFLTGCTGIPKGIEPVQNFDSRRYLGKWYEIARLDHSFERGLQQVSAEYTLREDGGIKVLNRGFNTAKNKWEDAEGKAYFVEDSNQGYLKVSFFGPFYGAYVIFDLGKNYEYSLITSHNRDFLWLLSRTPTIDETLKKELLAKMESRGFKTQDLIFVDQSGAQ